MPNGWSETMSELSSSDHPPGSRAVHRLQTWSALTPATGVAAFVSLCALTAAAISRQGDSLLVWFEAVASAVTLVMVFALQHTQTRQQVALQLKLDALLRALPGTDSRMIKVEAAPPEKIEEIKDPPSG